MSLDRYGFIASSFYNGPGHLSLNFPVNGIDEIAFNAEGRSNVICAVVYLMAAIFETVVPLISFFSLTWYTKVSASVTLVVLVPLAKYMVRLTSMFDR